MFAHTVLHAGLAFSVRSHLDTVPWKRACVSFVAVEREMSATDRLIPLSLPFPTTLTITSQPGTQPGPGGIFFHSDLSSDRPEPILLEYRSLITHW